MKERHPIICPLVFVLAAVCAQGTAAPVAVEPRTEARLFPLSDVRLLPGPFADAVAANRNYLLAHDPDRLLAPFFREAELKPKKAPYGNWESMGLDGHTAGHYLSALAQMIASGNDPDGEFGRRLDAMLVDLEEVQEANGNGYLGGIPGSREYWKAIGDGDVERIWKKWAPWYNVHKTFAGLRDAWLVADKPKAREILVKLGDWCVNLTSRLNDRQMQQMLGNEHGGMNEVMADIYTITGDRKYLAAAEAFNHRAVMDPLMNGEDKLTGLHANTQILKTPATSTSHHSARSTTASTPRRKKASGAVSALAWRTQAAMASSSTRGPRTPSTSTSSSRPCCRWPMASVSGRTARFHSSQARG